jgi:hypothetical protein
MDEKRRAQRQRTFKGGSISLSSGIVECVIRNLSNTGAMIECSQPAAVPDTFLLIIKPELLKRSCEVAWRSGKRIGVRFTNPEAEAPPGRFRLDKKCLGGGRGIFRLVNLAIADED